MQIFDPSLTTPTLAATETKVRKTKSKKSEEAAPQQHRGKDAVDITPRKTTGNSVTPHVTGRKAMDEVERALSSATDSIKVELYRLGYDKAIDILAAQARAGVKVQVLLDPTPGYDARDAEDQDRIRKHLEAAGCQILKYPIEESGKIDHVKLLIVDGKTAVIGGLNWDDHSPYNFDLNVTIQGPAVGDLDAVFQNDWHISGGEIDKKAAKKPRPSEGSEGDAEVTVITTDVGREDIRKSVMDNINKAERSIRMFAFAIADKEVVAGLIAARQRGVDVRVLVDPNKPMNFVNKKAEKELEEAGVAVRYLKVDLDNQEKMHAKAAFFDEETAIIGSANFTAKGLTVNHEADVEVISKTVGPALTNVFDDMWNNRSLEECPDLPDFQEVAPNEPFGELAARDLFDWWNGNYHPGEKRNWVGKKKEAILEAYQTYLKSGEKAPSSADEFEQIGSLAAFLENRKTWEVKPGIGSYEKIWKIRTDIAKEADQGVAQNIERYKQGMLDLVKDPALKNLLKDILDQAPEGFYKSPSSSTGKYHPADETRYADVKPRLERPSDEEKATYAGGGLVLHSRRNMEVAAHLCDYYGIEGKQRDEVLMGLALHDVLKFVDASAMHDWQPGQPIPWGQYTTKDHAHSGAIFVQKLDPTGGELSKNVRRYIDMHMAAWNWPEPTPPENPAEMIISLADYLASQPNYYVNV